MVVFMPLKAIFFSYEPRDHAFLSYNKGLKNIVALNTHDKILSVKDGYDIISHSHAV